MAKIYKSDRVNNEQFQKAITYETQELTEEQKQVARENLNVAPQNLVSNALHGTMHGTADRKDDVSGFAHNLAVVQFGQCVQDGTPSPATHAPISGKVAGGKVCGKNVLPYPYAESTITKNGLTFTVNDDGTIGVNGTATAQTEFSLVPDFIYNSNDYRFLSGCPSGGSDITYFLLGYTNISGSFKDFGSGVNCHDGANRLYQIKILIRAGVTVSDIVFKPQLEIGLAATSYEPYIAPTEYTVTDADGNAVTLYGIPVSSGGNVTVDGQMYIADTIEGNVLTRRVGKTAFDGTEGWSLSSDAYPAYYTRINNGAPVGSVDSIASHYPTVIGCYYSTYGACCLDSSKKFMWFTTSDAYASIADWKSYLAAQYAAGTPVTVYYALATPTTETVTVSTVTANSPTTTWLSDAYSEVGYNRDINKAYNQLLADNASLASRVAALEAAITSA